MKFPIKYNKGTMTLSIHIGKYYKYLQCPFATWWLSRKYFKRPRFKLYFGPMKKRYWFEGNSEFNIPPQYLYRDKGFFYFVSNDYIKWKTSKWFPILMESHDIMWKEKWGYPRYEYPGFFSIIFGRNVETAWQFAFIVYPRTIIIPVKGSTKKSCESDYWETMLTYLYYTKPKKSLIKSREMYGDDHWTTATGPIEPCWKNELLTKLGKEILANGTDKSK